MAEQALLELVACLFSLTSSGVLNAARVSVAAESTRKSLGIILENDITTDLVPFDM
jgi:hypothetical protein